jgi:hypothetical protein
MTNLTTGVETQLFVIGILGIKVVIQMAEDTNRRKVFGLAAPVAVGTGNQTMFSLQGKFCMGIYGTFPTIGAVTVTYLAFSGIIHLPVVGVLGIIVILFMAGKTGGGDSFILSLFMAVGTTGDLMHPF